MTSRRRFLVLSASTLLSGICRQPFAANSPIVRIGVLAPSHCALPVVLADVRGLFARAGISADVRYFPEMAEIARALAGGRLDFGQLAVPLAVLVSEGSAGPAQEALTIAQVLGTNGGALMVGTARPVRKLKELRGRRVGIHSPWIIHQVIFQRMMEMYGMLPGRDVALKQMPLDRLGPALQAGEIDAVIGPEPGPTFLDAEGLARPLLYTKTFWSDHPCCALVTRRARFEQDSRLVAEVTRVVMEAGLVLDNLVSRKGAIGDVHEHSPAYNRFPLELLVQAFGTGRSDFYPFPFHSSLRVVVEQMAKSGALPAGANPQRIATAMIPAPFALEILEQAAQTVPGARIPSGFDRDERLRIIGS